MKAPSSRWVRPVAASWVVLMAGAPALAVRIAENYNLPDAFTVLLSLLALMPASALALGFVLGRVNAWPALATAGVCAMAALAVEFEGFSDPHVRTDPAADVSVTGSLLLLFIALPLTMGGAYGTLCRACRTWWHQPVLRSEDYRQVAGASRQAP